MFAGVEMLKIETEILKFYAESSIESFSVFSLLMLDLFDDEYASFHSKHGFNIKLDILQLKDRLAFAITHDRFDMSDYFFDNATIHKNLPLHADDFSGKGICFVHGAIIVLSSLQNELSGKPQKSFGSKKTAREQILNLMINKHWIRIFEDGGYISINDDQDKIKILENDNIFKSDCFFVINLINKLTKNKDNLPGLLGA